jgi:hypothetical protein
VSSNSCNFTLAHYGEILRQAKAMSYRISRLREARSTIESGGIIFLRHDIDFSVEDAYRMAQFEEQLGVRSTYCVLLHAPTYSIGESSVRDMLRRMSGMGHEIALHYDLSFFEEAGIQANEGIRREAEFLGFVAGTTIETIAQHMPAKHGKFVPAGEFFLDAYAESLTQQSVYISDSRRIWRAGCIHERLGSKDRIQLLIHPEWWEADGPRERRETIRRLAQASQERIQQAMDAYTAGVDS